MTTPTVIPERLAPELPTAKASEHGNGSRNAELRYLRPDELSVWDAFVDKSPQGSVFSRSWWLHAIGGRVRILAYFVGGQLLAGMPLYFDRRYGLEVCTMPKLTQTLGPIMAPVNGRHVNAAWEEMEILSTFAKSLSQYSIVFQAFHPSLQNWCPFYWNGFTQTSRATHIIDLSCIDKVWSGMAHRTRRGVRNAERSGVKVTTCDPDQAWAAEQKTFALQGMKVPHTVDYLRGLYDAAKAHNGGECFAAVDAQRRVHAASFMVWDQNRCYAITMGGDPELRGRGSTSLLVWHMLQFAAGKSPIFDFTGSMLQPVELFLRSFGTTQMHYNWIMKFPLPVRLYLTMRHKI
ncbi:MAG TPA: GNAT family N-acetyltransferase [Terriglobales bacterium]|nr:GNAT family N-acetyltransferase [Terriglobales bacterium]